MRYQDLLKDPRLTENKIVQSFLSDRENYALYTKILEHPDDQKAIEDFNCRFKDFFTNIRMIKYLSSVIHYSTLEWNAKRKLSESLQELREDQLQYEVNDQVAEDRHTVSLDEMIEDEGIFTAIQQLTEKEKTIITMLFLQDLKETEVAMQLGISQQAVSKTKKRALTRLRKRLEPEDKKCPYSTW